MKIREGARQTMAWLHGWAGLLLGWVTYVMAFAGTLSVFKGEIGQWMRPENAATAAPAESVAAAIGWLQTHQPASPGWYLTAPSPRSNTIEAYWSEGTKFFMRALDPVTGAPAFRETLGGEFFYRLHFELQMPYPWGRLLASLAAAFMLVALVTGIIAHRRIFRDYFTFRPGSGHRSQRAWLDGHNALGVLALPFHLMITFTGLVTLATLIMPWGAVANYGNDLEKMEQAFGPGAIERPAAHKPGHLAAVLPMLNEAERRFGPNATIGRVSITNPADAASVVVVIQSDADQIGQGPHTISFDGPSGRILADWTEVRPAIRTYNVTYGLHMARFAPALLRWLYFLSGLALTATIASGLVLWIVKRRARAPLILGNRIAERLNVAVIAGTAIGFAGYFCANRLLALDTMSRSETEVAVALWTWAVAAFTGLALSPRIGWPLLFATAGVACIAAPVIGWIGPTPQPLGASLVLLASGAGFFAIALATRRTAAIPTPAARRPRVSPQSSPAEKATA